MKVDRRRELLIEARKLGFTALGRAFSDTLAIVQIDRELRELDAIEELTSGPSIEGQLKAKLSLVDK